MDAFVIGPPVSSSVAFSEHERSDDTVARSNSSNEGTGEEKALTNNGRVSDVASSTKKNDGRSRPLSDPRDFFYLSEMYCFIRQQLELFVATAEDVEDRSPRGGVKKTVKVGTVGVRCVHCARRVQAAKENSMSAALPSSTKKKEKALALNQIKGAVSYPQAIRLVYQSVRNWQRHHLVACPSMPASTNAKYFDLKKEKRRKRSASDSMNHWQKSLEDMGVVDTEAGMQLRNGIFEEPQALAGGPEGQQAVVEAPAFGVGSDDACANYYQAFRSQQNRVAFPHVCGNSVLPSPSESLEGADCLKIDTTRNRSMGGRLEHAVGASKPTSVLQGPSKGNCDGKNSGGDNDFFLNMRANAPSAQTFNVEMKHFPVHGTKNASPLVNSLSIGQEGSIPTAAVVENPFSGEHSQLSASAESSATIDEAADSGNGLADDSYADLFGGMHFGDATRSNMDRVSAGGPANEACACSAIEDPSPDILNVRLETSDSSEPIFDNKRESISRGVLVNQVELAHGIVEVAGEIQHLPPSRPSGEKESHEMRKNLVSLGVDLYELFAGRCPFDGKGGASEDGALSESEESLSEQPPHPQQRHQQKRDKRGQRKYEPLSESMGLPENLSALVSDLLDAASDGGTVNDISSTYVTLEEVRDDLRLMFTLPDKFLFSYDQSGHNIGAMRLDFSPDLLYGRSDESSQLLGVYHRMAFPTDGAASRGSSVALLSGYSGTGKSTLVRKTLAQYTKMGACCISGKFDAMQQVRPLSAIADALDEYCLMLAHNSGRLDLIRDFLSTALGEESCILADLIPNLREVLPRSVSEEHSPLPSHHEVLAGKEAQQHRLSRLIRMLLRVCSTYNKACPLVLFLDDLQWADDSSLEVINAIIMDAQIKDLLLVGCYRDNEVGPDHPLTVCLEGIRHSCGDAAITTLHISNLDSESVNALLSDLLHLLPRKTRSLADLVLQKTGGNALFVVQFLVSLCDEGLLRFSLTKRRWEWDVEGIQSREIADTFVEFISGKVLRLAPNVHKAVKVAAALGWQCHEDVFKIVDKGSHQPINTNAALDVAVSEGLMTKVEGPAYRFSHDQIQSAAYLLIPDSDREAFHLQIGRSLLQHSSNEEMDNYLFVTVDQLHRGGGLVTDHNEKAELVQLSVLAGQKAFAMSAFLPALAYLTAGVNLLAEEDWEMHRSLCFDIYNLCAETEYILGHFEGMEEHLDTIFQRATSFQEKLQAYYTLVQSLIAKGDIIDAISTALNVLGSLGEHFPSDSSEMLVMQELITTQRLFSAKTQDELLQLKKMDGAEKLEAMRWLNLIISATYAAKREFFPLLICRLCQLSLLHGVCSESAVGFCFFGVIRSGNFCDFAGGYQYGKLAIATLNKFRTQHCFTRVHVVMYCFVSNWIEPLQSSLSPLKQAIDFGLKTGDIEYACMGAHMYAATALASGCPLGPLYEKLKLHAKQMVEFKQQYAETYNRPLRQTVLNLLGKSTDPTKLVGEEMDESKMIGVVEDPKNEIFNAMTYLHRMYLEYLFGEYNRAEETAKKNENIPKQCVGRFVAVCNFTFYRGLTALALAREEGMEQYAGTIDKAMHLMEVWSSSTRWNCQHKLELMNAEYAFLSGKEVEAATAYFRAAELASDHRFLHEEALIFERAGIFHLHNGDHDKASGLFSKAYDCYMRWGACSKACHVRDNYL